ncbi:hypothetical protein [Fusobacterium vincentii ATCC 49256]|uniref:dUTP diphosphatase n=1 Tax=Fusobacterium vincentii ATCC 49256 TaxID=209882 RepID=Q7P8B8_FUSVC|nr:hypothetical protein [Fusobacterium vincentii ATCC 49256]
MEIKKPKNFRGILSLQKYLDDNINNIRTRTFEDIKMSLIAECVEFNEETMFSHKTWKTKEYRRDKELEELTDVYFFFAQLINYLDDDENEALQEAPYISRERSIYFIPVGPEKLRMNSDYVYTDKLAIAMDELIAITYQYNYTTDNILNSYWVKWNRNMRRIGKEWN